VVWTPRPGLSDSPFLSCPSSTPPASALSLHDALPILIEITAPRDFFAHRNQRHGLRGGELIARVQNTFPAGKVFCTLAINSPPRSEEHTSELQSHLKLVCSRLLAKKNSRRLCNR